MEVQSRLWPLTMGLLVVAFTGCVHAAAEVGPAQSAEISGFGSTEGNDDCEAMPLKDKEACYAALPEAMIRECEQMRLYRCAPYARFHSLELRLGIAQEQLLAKAKDAYRGYEDGQPGYVEELKQALASSFNAWGIFRDAHCSAEPLVQGMSRSEASDLSEACRVSMMESRLQELESVSDLMDENQHDQRSN
jgi:Protein of unknown function (DUF1311).